MQKIYNRVNWENKPSTRTPINASNLNIMDFGLDALDDRVIELWDLIESFGGLDIEDIQKRLDILYKDENTPYSILNVIKQYMDMRTAYDHDDMMEYIFGPDKTLYFLKQPTNVRIKNTDEGFSLKWKDPDDYVSPYDPTKTLAYWAGTRVIIKEGAPPVDAFDGDAKLVTVETVRDNFNSTDLFKGGLKNGATYYIGIFPFTTFNQYTTSLVIQFTPQPVYPNKPTIDNGTNLDGAVKLDFTLPSDASIFRLVYGLHEPKSNTDGTVVSLSSADVDKTINNLTNNMNYYFKIYVYNSKNRETESDSFEFMPTEAPPVPATVRVYTGTKDGEVSYEILGKNDMTDTVKFLFNSKRVPINDLDSDISSKTITAVNSTSTITYKYAHEDIYYAVYTYNKKGKKSLTASGTVTTGGDIPTAFDDKLPYWRFVDMIKRARKGEIDLKDYWAIENKRTFQIENTNDVLNFYDNTIKQYSTIDIVIAGFDTDVCSDDSKKTLVTFSYNFSDSVLINDATTANSNWKDSLLRKWMNDNLYNYLSKNFFKDLDIKPTIRKYYTDNTLTTINTVSDYLTIPSRAEVIYTNNSSLIRTNDGESNIYKYQSRIYSGKWSRTPAPANTKGNCFYRLPFSYQSGSYYNGSTTVYTYNARDYINNETDKNSIVILLSF